jgi:hypothetical protein
VERWTMAWTRRQVVGYVEGSAKDLGRGAAITI